ncbi:MAG: SDR family NAD(P)-dependent oxidoreductase, partial [Chloroflexi bacterium]|nr:SDR family NAD(P)-dependent oxidoreductase [Chloroflexota bacterium]
MELGLKEKVVLVTGASRGIGKAIAAAFAAEGSFVVLNARKSQELELVVEEMQQHGRHALGIAADLTDASAARHLAEQTIAHFGTIHVLVNNVGGAEGFAPFEEVSDEAWSNAFQLNVLSTVRLIRAVLPAMKQQHWGRVINISSEAGTQPDPFLPHYGAAKAAVTNLTKSLSRTYAEAGILANTVSPGWTWTPLIEQIFTAQAKARGVTLEEFRLAFLRESRPHLALSRAAMPEEVASAVVYLA